MYNYISDKMNERIQNYKTNLKRGKVFEILSIVIVIVLSLKLLDGEKVLIPEYNFIAGKKEFKKHHQVSRHATSPAQWLRNG